MTGINAVKSSVDKNEERVSDPTAAGAGDLNQIREILFGAEVRRYDARLLQLESRFEKKVELLQKEMMAQFADMKKLLGQSSADMTEKLNVEKEQRSDAHQDLSNRLIESAKQMQARIDQGENEIKALMQDQLTRLQKEVDEQHQAAVNSADRMIAELKSQKANSEDLSSLFAEISSRLSGTPKKNQTPNATDQKK